VEREPALRIEHAVVFYDDQSELTAAVERFFAPAGCVDVVVASPEHLALFRPHVPGAIEVDASTLLDSFCVDGEVSAEGFQQTVGELVRQAGSDGRPVRVYGEMVTLLWERRLVSQAIELEGLWEALGQELPFSLLCAYPSSLVLDHDDPAHVNHVAARHRDVGVRAFGASPTSIRAVRLFVGDWLGEGFKRFDVALLIASELATNAVQHSAAPFVVEVAPRPEGVRISVRDRSTAQVGARVPPAHAESGRGLGLVDALSTAWGVRWTPNGKVVWADISAD
jgi:anti-sigma regulatory factor (Ser/Thr protein kinase)